MKIFETKIKSNKELYECIAIWKQCKKDLSKTNSDIVWKMFWDKTDKAQIIFHEDSCATWFVLMHGNKFKLKETT